MKPFTDLVVAYYQRIKPPTRLPENVEVLNPYQDPQTLKIVSDFYHKYYNDKKERFICFGINPGRFGAGVTGVPFTDPIRLQEICEIPNDFEKKSELSSKFIYEMIDAYGGPVTFYSKFYVSAVSPLGYMKEGINLNYYDIKNFKEVFEKYAIDEIRKQLDFGISTKVAFSIGKGENVKFLEWLNKKYKVFQEIIPLPHPRWVMQYRLKRKREFIQEYVNKLNKAH